MADRAGLGQVVDAEFWPVGGPVATLGESPNFDSRASKPWVGGETGRGSKKGSVRGGKRGEAEGRSFPTRSSFCPPDFEPTEKHRARAKELGVDLDRELRFFRMWEFYKPRRDWNATLRVWIERAAEINAERELRIQRWRRSHVDQTIAEYCRRRGIEVPS